MNKEQKLFLAILICSILIIITDSINPVNTMHLGGGGRDVKQRLPVKGGGGAKSKAATDGVSRTPKMSAKKKKKIQDQRNNSELKKKNFIAKMKLAFLESDPVRVEDLRHEKFLEKIVMFKNVENKNLSDNLKTNRKPYDSDKNQIKNAERFGNVESVSNLDTSVKSRIEFIEGQIKPTLCKTLKGKPDGTRIARKTLNLKLFPDARCPIPALEKGGVGNSSSSTNGNDTLRSFGMENRLSLECDIGTVNLNPKLIPYLKAKDPDQILDQWEARRDTSRDDREGAVANGRGTEGLR